MNPLGQHPRANKTGLNILTTSQLSISLYKESWKDSISKTPRRWQDRLAIDRTGWLTSIFTEYHWSPEIIKYTCNYMYRSLSVTQLVLFWVLSTVLKLEKTSSKNISPSQSLFKPLLCKTLTLTWHNSYHYPAYKHPLSHAPIANGGWNSESEQPLTPMASKESKGPQSQQSTHSPLILSSLISLSDPMHRY